MNTIQPQTVLITGASGFLGTYMGDACAAAGHRLIGLDLRAPLRPQLWHRFITASCETAPLGEILQQENVQVIYHLAGGASVPASVENPLADFAALLPGTMALVAAMLKRKPDARLVFFSSAAVYGNPESLPITEDTPLKPISPYGIHKAAVETLLQHYSRAFGLRMAALRIFSAFGPGLRKQLIWDVSQRALTAAAKGEKQITLFGTGAETRDFIHATDIARAAMLVAGRDDVKVFEIFNIASGREIQIADVARLLIKGLGLAIAVKFDGKVRAGDPLNWRADISRLAGLGFRNSITVEQGLVEVGAWVKNGG